MTSQIEKIARLMGHEVESVTEQGVWLIEHDKPLNRDNEHPIRLFNPLTNKSDLMDVECALGIDVIWNESGEYVHAVKRTSHLEYIADKYEDFITNNNDKFTARSNAVCAVAEIIYDKGQA